MTPHLILSALGGAAIGMILMALCVMASERRDIARVTAALWEVILKMRLADTRHVGVRAILEKHGVEIPKDEVVY